MESLYAWPYIISYVHMYTLGVTAAELLGMAVEFGVGEVVEESENFNYTENHACSVDV